MAKVLTKYVCQSCGYVSPRWVGKCPNCSEWNTFVEEAPSPIRLSKKPTGAASKIEPVPIQVATIVPNSTKVERDRPATAKSSWFLTLRERMKATPTNATM